MEETILTFENVSLEARPPYEVGLDGVSFSLGKGGLALVRVDEGVANLPLADAAEGLVAPAQGAVRFLGEDWRGVPPDRAAAWRGRIGRVFESHGWISNIDADENITLSQRHHTQRPEEEIAKEAEQLAVSFGMAELPHARPALLRRADLRRIEWVRAFLGAPDLVVLEQPMRDMPADGLPRLVQAVNTACARGAAVLWILTAAQSWPAVEARDVQRFEMRGSNLVPVEGK